MRDGRPRGRMIVIATSHATFQQCRAAQLKKSTKRDECLAEVRGCCYGGREVGCSIYCGIEDWATWWKDKLLRRLLRFRMLRKRRQYLVITISIIISTV